MREGRLVGKEELMRRSMHSGGGGGRIEKWGEEKYHWNEEVSRMYRGERSEE